MFQLGLLKLLRCGIKLFRGENKVYLPICGTINGHKNVVFKMEMYGLLSPSISVGFLCYFYFIAVRFSTNKMPL